MSFPIPAEPSIRVPFFDQRPLRPDRSGTVPPGCSRRNSLSRRHQESGFALPAGFLLTSGRGNGTFCVNSQAENISECVRQFDTDQDGKLSEAEIPEVGLIDCQNPGIKNLEGIQCFTELSVLCCRDNLITRLPE